jgi:hypothetical protein
MNESFTIDEIQYDHTDKDEGADSFPTRAIGPSFADHVITPEGYRGQLTSFDGEGQALVHYTDVVVGRMSSKGWYDLEDLTIAKV